MRFLEILKLLETLYTSLCKEAGVKFNIDESDFQISKGNCDDDYYMNIHLDDNRWIKITLLMPNSMRKKWKFLPWSEWALRVRKLKCGDRPNILPIKFGNRPLHSEYDLLHRRGEKPYWKKESYYKPMSFIIANPRLPWDFNILYKRRDITVDDFQKMNHQFRCSLKDCIPNTDLLNIGVKPCITLTTPADIMNFPNINWNFKDLSYYMDFEFMVSTLDKYPWDVRKSYAFRAGLDRYRAKKKVYEYYELLIPVIRNIIISYV